MASWKRLFGKKHKKTLRKLEREYNDWIANIQENYSPRKAVSNVKNSFALNRKNRTEHEDQR